MRWGGLLLGRYRKISFVIPNQIPDLLVYDVASAFFSHPWRIRRFASFQTFLPRSALSVFWHEGVHQGLFVLGRGSDREVPNAIGMPLRIFRYLVARWCQEGFCYERCLKWGDATNYQFYNPSHVLLVVVIVSNVSVLNFIAVFYVLSCTWYTYEALLEGRNDIGRSVDGKIEHFHKCLRCWRSSHSHLDPKPFLSS